MAKVIYFLATGALYAALGYGLDARGMLGAGLVCWSMAGVCAVASAYCAWGAIRG